jgi:hypothetical protein
MTCSFFISLVEIGRAVLLLALNIKSLLLLIWVVLCNIDAAVVVGSATIVLFLFNKRLRNRFNSFSFSSNSNCIFALTTSVLRIWFTEKDVPLPL